MLNLRDHLLRGRGLERVPTHEVDEEGQNSTNRREPAEASELEITNHDSETSETDGTRNDSNSGEGIDEHNLLSTSSHEPLQIASRGSEEEHTSDELTELLLTRERHRKATLVWFCLLLFMLVRMWATATETDSLGLLIIAVSLTFYVVAWRVYRLYIGLELNDMISELQRTELRRAEGSSENDAGRHRRRGRRSRRLQDINFDDWDLSFARNREHIDLEMLGFQAQLAIAIMESQRHIIETGGYGRPDDENDENEVRGVSQNTKAKWETFKFDTNHPKVKVCSDLKPDKNEDPSCCICLCEYEKGELLTQLGCNHVYHKDCIDSWCENHTRCPLCNTDLEEINGEGADEIV